VKASLLDLLACPGCGGAVQPSSPAGAEISDGTLSCISCRREFPIRRGVPSLLDEPSPAEARTQDLYADIWREFTRPRTPSKRGYDAPATSHLELLRLAAGRELVQGKVGVDAGCGNGATVLEMAGRHPDVTVVGVDLSPGLVVLAEAARGFPNAHLVQGNLLAPPLARSRFDFVYSFGVLHHTRDPESAFRQLLACLRPGGIVTLFVYKDFSDIPTKRMLLVPVTALRRWTTGLRPPTLRRLARLCAPFVYAGLTLPARGLRRVGAARFARHLPYGTFPGVHSVASSLEDRFGAPYEHRFSADDLGGWVERAGLESARVVDCLPFGFSGLVLSGVAPTPREPPPPKGV
jgi:SAM-dependent methyltransferase